MYKIAEKMHKYADHEIFTNKRITQTTLYANLPDKAVSHVKSIIHNAICHQWRSLCVCQADKVISVAPFTNMV